MHRILYISVLALLLLIDKQLFSCTTFCLKTADGIFLAKNLDWSTEEGYLFLNQEQVTGMLYDVLILG